VRCLSSKPKPDAHGRRPVMGALLALLAATLWLGGVAAGLGGLAGYATTAEPAPPAPGRWPLETRLELDPARPTLVLFLHPRCPCSAATLTELNRVLARVGPSAARVTVAVYAPTTEPAGWDRTPLRGRAAGLPGVCVVDDADGQEARRFGAARSGHAVLYGPEGRLRFSGGLTASRGHEGDNAGADTVAAVLAGRPPVAERTPTFGCEIVAGVAAGCPLCASEGSP